MTAARREGEPTRARSRSGVEPTFGTDGVRGRAFDELDEVVVHALGRAAGTALDDGSTGTRWVVGRDTRESGPALTGALAAGLRATGAAVADLGIVPTPFVAFAAQHLGAAGAMVSASHNPWHDNGVKLFAAGGAKLSDAEQSAVAQHLAGSGLTHADRPSPADIAKRQSDRNSTPSAAGDGLARATDDPLAEAASGAAPTSGEQVAAEVLAAYRASLSAVVEDRSLEGLHLVVDGANGAQAGIAPGVLGSLGAQVTTIFCEPDGRNINDGCGSVHPAALQHAVAEQQADLGLAFDGDGDRLIAVDSAGQLIDGDRQMALFAVDMAERGQLAADALVVTVMSNLGLRRAMAAVGIEVIETAVGDRAVLEALDAGGCNLGGEQSGHVIFRREATTGDGLRSAVHLADLVARRTAGHRPSPTSRAAQTDGGEATRSRPTSADLAAQAMHALPQVLRNVAAGPGSLDEATLSTIDAIAAEAGSLARVLVRASGTEPVIRVMVEAPTQQAAADLADRLVNVVTGG